MTTAQITFGDLNLDVTFKDIKNVHLSVHPPLGKITISAPLKMSLETVRAFAVTKIGWVRRQQRKLLEAHRAPQLEYLNRESHYLWGQRYLLRIVNSTEAPSVSLSNANLTLRISSSSTAAEKAAVMAKWQRGRILDKLPAIAEHWSKVLNVKIPEIRVRQMKTKWGSCNHERRSILLNTELAKKPVECLEYVVLHEMAHLLESTHNQRFTTIMDRAMPNWRIRRDILNALPTPNSKK